MCVIAPRQGEVVWHKKEVSLATYTRLPSHRQGVAAFHFKAWGLVRSCFNPTAYIGEGRNQEVDFYRSQQGPPSGPCWKNRSLQNMVSCVTLVQIINLKNRGYTPKARVLEEFLGKLALVEPDGDDNLNLIVATYLVRVIFDDEIYGLDLTAQLTEEDSPVGIFLSQLGILTKNILHHSDCDTELLSRTHCEYRKFLEETAPTYALESSHAPLYVHNLKPSLDSSDEVVLETTFGAGATGRVIYTESHKTHFDALVDAANSFSLQGVEVDRVAKILAHNNMNYADSGSTEKGIIMLTEALTRTALNEDCIRRLSNVLENYREIMSNYEASTANINIGFMLRPTSVGPQGGIGLFDLKYVYHEPDISRIDRGFVTASREKMREFIALGDARVGLYVRETFFPAMIILFATSFLVIGVLVTFQMGLKLSDAHSANFLSYSAILSGAALSVSPKLRYRDWEYYDFLRLRRKTYSLLDFCDATSWDFEPSVKPRTVKLRRMPSFRRSTAYLFGLLKCNLSDHDDRNSTWNIDLTMSEIYAALASYHEDGSLDLSGPYGCMFTTQPKSGISIDLCPQLIEFIHTTRTLSIQPSRQTVGISIQTVFNKRNLTLELTDRTLKHIHHALPGQTVIPENPTNKARKNVLLVEAQVVGLAPVLQIRVG